MQVVLDSTVLCQDFRLTGNAFRVFRQARRLVPAHIFVPEVVIDEVVNRFTEELRSTTTKAESSAKQIAKLIGKEFRGFIEKIKIEHQAEAYRTWLLGELKGMDAEILLYPNVSHRKVVAHALQRRKPFAANGAGYRDYLIWKNVWELTFVGTERTVFVTTNKKDFGEGPKLPEDLRKDVIAPQRVEIIQGLQRFNDRFVLPLLKVSEELKAKLESHAVPVFDVQGWLTDNLADMLWDDPSLGEVVGIPARVSVHASRVVQFDRVSINEARELPNGEHLLVAEVRAEIDLSISVSGNDYAEHHDVRAWMGPETEWFESADWNEAHTLTIGVRLVLDPSGKEINDYEPAFVEGPDGRVDYS